MKMRFLASLLILLVATPALAAHPLGEPFTLRIGDSAEVGDEGLVVRLVDIPSDGRCPLSVVCVWEGVAEVLVGARLPDQPEEELLLHTLTGTPQFHPMEADYASYRVRLIDLWPYPATTEPINPGVYILTLVVDEVAVPVDEPTWSTLKAHYRK